MSDETNNNSGSVSNMPPLPGGNGPRLRKIKRPIKKLVQRPLPGQPQPARPIRPACRRVEQKQVPHGILPESPPPGGCDTFSIPLRAPFVNVRTPA